MGMGNPNVIGSWIICHRFAGRFFLMSTGVVTSRMMETLMARGNCQAIVAETVGHDVGGVARRRPPEF
jgi:hypothetical protein